MPTPDDVCVGIDQFLDVVGGLVDLHQAHVVAAGNRDNDALGPLHRNAVEERVGDCLLGSFDGAVVAFGFAGAHHRLAHFAHHRTNVCEVEIDEPGHHHKISDPAHALLEYLVRHLERFLEGRVRVGDQKQVLIGNDDQRVDMLLQLLDAGIGRAHAAIAFEAERLRHHTHRQNATITRCLGDDRGRAGTGAATHAGGDEAHMRAFERAFDLIKRLLGCGAPDFRTGARAKALGNLEAKLNTPIGSARVERLRIGVGDDEFDTLHVGGDHVGDRIPSGPADADDADPWLQLIDFRTDELNRHEYSPQWVPRARPTGYGIPSITRPNLASRESQDARKKLTAPSFSWGKFWLMGCRALFLAITAIFARAWTRGSSIR